MKGRMRAEASGDLSDSNYDTLEKIGIDYKWPFRTESVHNYNGFHIFSDNNSNLVYKDKCDWCMSSAETVQQCCNIEDYAMWLRHYI